MDDHLCRGCARPLAQVAWLLLPAEALALLLLPAEALALMMRPEEAAAQLLPPAEEVAEMTWLDELAEPPARLAQQQSRWWTMS